MTALAQRITETPMAPYIGVLRSMTREEKQIVVTFLTESLAPAKKVEAKVKLTKEERKRGLMSLAGCWADDPEDAARMEAAIKEARKNDFVREVNLDITRSISPRCLA